MGDSGIKGSRAGTNLSQMILKLANPTKKGKGVIDRLGISLYKINKDGKKVLKPLSDILDQFKETNAGLTEFQQLLGVRGGRAFGSLINGAEKYKKVLDKISGSGGLTDQLAEKKMETTAGKVFVMQSKFDDLSITLMDKVRPAFNFVVDGLGTLFDKMQNSPKILAIVENAANSVAVGLRVAYEVGKFLFNLIYDNWSTIVSLLSALAAIKLAMMGISAWSAIMTLVNPFTLWVAGALALVVALDQVAKLMPTTEEMGDKFEDGWDVFTSGLGDIWQAGSTDPMSLSDRAELFGKGFDDFWGAWDPEHMERRKNGGVRIDGTAGASAPPSNKPKNLHDELFGGLGEWLKGIVAPKGGNVEKTLKQIEEIIQTGGNIGGFEPPNEGKSGASVLNSATPLSSVANEMSRSIVVNMDQLLNVENQYIGTGTDGSIQADDLTSQLASALTKVVKDYELGMSM